MTFVLILRTLKSRSKALENKTITTYSYYELNYSLQKSEQTLLESNISTLDKSRKKMFAYQLSQKMLPAFSIKNSPCMHAMLNK